MNEIGTHEGAQHAEASLDFEVGEEIVDDCSAY